MYKQYVVNKPISSPSQPCIELYITKLDINDNILPKMYQKLVSNNGYQLHICKEKREIENYIFHAIMKFHE